MHMSIDSEISSTASSSGGNRAPPPPFTQSQRKRPALSNLGIDVSLASDIKTPNTPTPNFTNETINSDTFLNVRQTPTPNPLINVKGTNTNTNTLQPIQQQYYATNNASDEEIREPQLIIVLEALSDFQRHFDQKSHTIELLDNQTKTLISQLQHRENELQSAATERISNLKLLETHKHELKGLGEKLKEFGKYETLIASKFESLENLMSEMITTKAQFLTKETDLRNELDGREKRLNEALKSIQELRIEKESLETQLLTLENEKTESFTEFNSRIYNLNAEIKEKSRKIEFLTGDNEVLLSDLKNITSDRDRIQKECSIALKNITELAVSESFTCDSNDLGNLEKSVAWIKSQCIELKNSKVTFDLERIAFSQTIQELEKNIKTQKTVVDSKVRENLVEFENVKFLLESKEEKLRIAEIELEEHKTELEIVDQFKEKAKKFGFSDDFEFYDKIIETICQQTSFKRKLEALNNEILQLKRDNSIEVANQKEEYGNLLREETSKWKIEREELENEISKLKKLNQQQQMKIQTQSQTQSQTQNQTQSQNQFQDSDLTAIIKDLKESSELLNSGSGSKITIGTTGNSKGLSMPSAKRTVTTTSHQQNQKMKIVTSNNNNATNFSNNNKRRHVSSNVNTQKISSPNSVNSNDIWSLFK